TRRRHRNLATCGLPDPAFCLPKSRTVLRYRPCDINERFDVAVFSRSFAGACCPLAVDPTAFDRLKCAQSGQTTAHVAHRVPKCKGRSISTSKTRFARLTTDSRVS